MKKTVFTAITKIAIYAILFIATKAQATNTPVIHCFRTQPNGSIQITWEPVTTYTLKIVIP